MLVVAARPGQARALRDEITCWHPRPAEVVLFPELDILPYEPLAPDQQTTSERLAVLTQLLEREGEWRCAAPLVIACARAVADLLAAPAAFAAGTRRLKVGDHARPEELLQSWLDLGYEPVPVVDSPGPYGRRGRILGIYPPAGDACP